VEDYFLYRYLDIANFKSFALNLQFSINFAPYLLFLLDLTIFVLAVALFACQKVKLMLGCNQSQGSILLEG